MKTTPTANSDETDEMSSANRRDPNNPHMIVLPSGKKVPTNGKKFRPGRSGNAKGRPKRDLDLAKEARKHAQKAIDALVGVLDAPDAPHAQKISAASELLDRGFGRSPQQIDVNHKHDFSQELSAFLRRLHQEETGQLSEKHGSSGVIEADVIDAEIILEEG